MQQARQDTRHTAQHCVLLNGAAWPALPRLTLPLLLPLPLFPLWSPLIGKSWRSVFYATNEQRRTQSGTHCRSALLVFLPPRKWIRRRRFHSQTQHRKRISTSSSSSSSASSLLGQLSPLNEGAAWPFLNAGPRSIPASLPPSLPARSLIVMANFLWPWFRFDWHFPFSLCCRKLTAGG